MKNKIITFFSLKGGVGKTTTCTNVAVALGKVNKKILVIDLDPISNASSNFGLTNIKPQSLSLFYPNYDEKNINKNILNNVDCISSSIELSFGFLKGDIDLMAKNFKNNLEVLKTKYDLIFIDTSPSWGLMNEIILSTTDSIIIPFQCNQFSLETIPMILSIIRKVQVEKNPILKIEGILITKFDKRSTNCSNIFTEFSKTFNNDLYDIIIPQDIAISKLQSENKTIVESMPWKPSGLAYTELAKEIIMKMK